MKNSVTKLISKEEALEKLKINWKTDSLVLEGKYTKSLKGNFGFFNEVVEVASSRSKAKPSEVNCSC